MSGSPMRSLIRQTHMWLGLSLGGLFVLLGLTGSILVFYTEIDAILNPEIRIESSAEPDWDLALQTVRIAYPDKAGPWRFEVPGRGKAIPARYYDPPETAGRAFAPMMVWLSPDGSRVLRRDYWGDYAMTFVYDLHYRLLLGEFGGKIVGYTGLLLFFLLLSGLWAWWPRSDWHKALRYKVKAAPLRQLRDQHKLAGLVGVPLLLMLVVTGVMLALPDESDAVLGTISGPVDAAPQPVSQNWQGAPISVSTAMLRARTALPAGRIAWVEVPSGGDGAFRIRMQIPGDPSLRFPHSFVWIDQYDGRVLAIVDARRAGVSTTINNWLHPLHDGSAGGLALRILAAIAGLIPLILFWTGLVRWRLRRTRATSQRPKPSRSIAFTTSAISPTARSSPNTP
ncbi:PepSY domain-containing protein [uncultured Sphingorhabdus sp.]|uniref:PepSY-associated TM helix domain-containing protein n=1 Tax=uncultured Sphingorhabdus sp. TaxID=1686106 RepID=UPI00261A711E|nr:PepSY domain-containing protein [uncultured Sphingorhabdus sp.]HMS19520.1 PepSY domain-containing protein [Sphingorhabdus sp.]